MKGFTWTKEPSFSSEEADRLNLQLNDPAGREVEFLVDRIKHQRYLQDYQPLVCDRYIWSGLAYSKVFSPQYFPLLEKLYDHPFFDKPDYYVFVDTPIETCMQRCSRAQTKEQLNSLRESFLSLSDLILKNSKIITIQATEPVDLLVDTVWAKIQASEEAHGKPI